MSKSNKNRERRDRVEELRKQAKAAERRRSLMIIAACSVVALLIVGIAVISIVNQKNEEKKIAAQELTDIGSAAEAAGCTAIKEKDATGAGQHTTAKVTYDTVPPSYGKHNPTPD